MNEPKPIAGWTFPTAESRKCHYFDADEMRSLCGKYMLFRRDPRRMSPDTRASRDDCVACRRKLDQRTS